MCFIHLNSLYIYCMDFIFYLLVFIPLLVLQDLKWTNAADVCHQHVVSAYRCFYRIIGPDNGEM